MTETEIVNLYWQRSPQAIQQSQLQFGRYCFAIACGILSDSGEAEESVNDTWLDAWNSMPPKRPQSLKAYLGKLCRHISLSRLRRRMAQKRGGGEAMLAMEELGDCVPDRCDVQGLLEAGELEGLLNRFLGTLRERERSLFVGRYWYALSVKDLALKWGMKEGTVKSSLHRSREQLRVFLEKEGYR